MPRVLSALRTCAALTLTLALITTAVPNLLMSTPAWAVVTGPNTVPAPASQLVAPRPPLILQWNHQAGETSASHFGLEQSLL
jgi:hypothetical protein